MTTAFSTPGRGFTPPWGQIKNLFYVLKFKLLLNLFNA